MHRRATIDELQVCDERSWWRPLAAPVVGLAALLLVGVAGIMAVEGWTLGEAVWMVVITVSTIGYGELHPLSAAGRAWMTGYILVTMVYTGATVTRLASLVIDGELSHALRTRRMKMTLDALTDHGVVIGWGRLGREIVQDLTHHGLRVVIIDPQPGASPTPDGATLIVGDATRDEVLRQAGVARARAVAVATPSDAINIYLALSVRQLNPTASITVRLEDDQDTEKALRAGANRVFLPYHLSGARMSQAMLRPRASQFVEQVEKRSHPDLTLEDVLVREGSPLVGPLRPDALRQAHGVVVVAVHGHAEDRMELAGDEVSLSAGDTLVVVGADAAVRAFLAYAQPV
jgi:voltage-gated potassium channel